ncbi:MAG: hypothetical protein J6N92_04215 [Alloprevotella sp.]|nr:hypothetical protein [Alloprevotella sp.]
MGKHIRTFILHFDTEIAEREIPLFRGAVIRHLGDEADLLYHNHVGTDHFRYAYPLIQYKRIGGRAAIVCLERGTDLIGQYLWNLPDEVLLGDTLHKLSIRHVIPRRVLVQTWDDVFPYHIYKWAPLNAENYQAYKALSSADERKVFLEGILKANILSMLKGLDIHLEEQLQLEITNLSSPYVLPYKRIGLTAFNADFTCNLSIPDQVGLGKNVSTGFGVVRRVRQASQNEEEKTK